MSDTIIKVEQLYKKYKLGKLGHHTLQEEFGYWWSKITTKQNLKEEINNNVLEINNENKEIWALQNINFEIKQGEVLGIIGKNGAGKSTLLKILSKITSPTKGQVKVKGRIASLLEVGTGFHPELTGRENIFLNGAILGMTKPEVRNKLDEIIEFSGVSRYIDTPVKKYSSGMYVRLAFAVAAHLEPEILIVDEVLAVGDYEFQQKCLDKLNAVSKEGKTVIFVSHNMLMVEKLCKRSIVLKDGSLTFDGSIEKSMMHYFGINKKTSTIYQSTQSKTNNKIFIKRATLFFNKEEDIVYIDLTFKVLEAVEFALDLRLLSYNAIPIAFGSLGVFDKKKLVNFPKGTHYKKITFSSRMLAVGKYYISFDLNLPDIKYFERIESCLAFDIPEILDDQIRLKSKWNYGYFDLKLQDISEK